MEQTKKPKTKAIITGGIIAILAILVIILLVIIINSNKDITLTKDNVKDYFYILFDNINPRGQLKIRARAISDNFTYEGVEIEVELLDKIIINGTTPKTVDFEGVPIKIKCNIAGDGDTLITEGKTDYYGSNAIHYKITSAKGKVKPVGK